MTQNSGVYTLQQQGQALTSGQWATEPYFKNTTLLLHADGVSGGAQNNSFIDSSTNNFTVTRNGNTTQGSFTPYGPTWSNYFSGGANYLSLSSNAAFGVGTGDFTIECWVYPTSAWSAGSYNPIFFVAGTGLYFGQNATGFGLRQSGTADIIGYATSPALNVWTHVAIVRSGTTVTMYYNGASVATATSSANFGSGAVQIGYDGSYGLPTSYISNLRLVKGTAVYTAAFQPSTAPLTNITNTSLLTCQSNRFIDTGTANSGSPFTITVNGTPSVQRFTPFAPQFQYTPAVIGGSGYFDGTTDFLTVPKDTSLEPATNGSWCLETWVYAASNTAGIMQVVAYANASVGSGPDLGYFITHYPGNYVNGGFYSGGSQYAITSASSFATINEWQHVALTSDGTTMRLFINGVSVGTPVTVTGVSINAPSSALFKVGQYSSNQYLVGYTSDTRFVKGSAVYTTTFTPPTAPLIAISNTSLLMNYTNAGIYDNAMMNDLETVGDVQVSTSVVKYGSGSIKFDGASDYLTSTAATALYVFGTGDFTIEMWIYPTALTSTEGATVIFYDQRPASTDGNYPCIYMESGQLRYFVNSADRITGLTLSINTWYHVAVCRSGTSTKMFLNGTQTGSTWSDSTNYLNGAARPIIGTRGYLPGDNDYTGYIDDLRITKGVARYTANFQPPKVAFANQ